MTPPRAAGALLLLFDVVPEDVVEHDEWHTHEHMPERLALPGFRRGTRWSRAAAGPRYAVVYEVDHPSDLDSPAYRARLDQPTPWTARMMTRYRGMRRTLCAVRAGDGEGIGATGLVVTLTPQAGREVELRERLLADVLPALSRRPGLASWRLLENAQPAPMTREQAIRGRDEAVHSAVWVTGYDAAAVASLSSGDLSAPRLAPCGAAAVEHAVFALAFALTAPAAPAAPAAGVRQ